jgi:hypothetical protein
MSQEKKEDEDKYRKICSLFIRNMRKQCGRINAHFQNVYKAFTEVE